MPSIRLPIKHAPIAQPCCSTGISCRTFQRIAGAARDLDFDVLAIQAAVALLPQSTNPLQLVSTMPFQNLEPVR